MVHTWSRWTAEDDSGEITLELSSNKTVVNQEGARSH